jgi:holo-[acyl-carrier protein] synthase
MITGVGIDIIEVDRVEEKVAKDRGFREKVFSAAEISFCEKGARSFEQYAARFAAKEAFLKATGKGLTSGYELSDIEIVNDALGKPELKLHNAFSELAEISGWKKIHVSLSHIRAAACAVVIIES